ncbi:cytochrome P450 6B5-like [Leguminivora glycinivorella]|uniref:cytochrome P450 6B5-like n=1 Tax=Leguminivora glycinivorella TaxID=1035111 RepID=UPI00200CFC00|nr:cytochrome P450 6B5-like [Leguminivora glycinivorella]
MYPIILLCVVVALIFLYLIGRYNKNYWRKRGVAFYDKNKVFGLFWDFLTTEKAMFEILSEIYKSNENAPAVGIGSLMTPSLYVMDPQNVHHVMQTDFQSFTYRGPIINEGDLLGDNVLFMNGPRWKLMRQKLTPFFTAAKLRNMYYILDRTAQDFVEHLKQNPQKLKGNGFDRANEFCAAAIAAAVFGIGTDSSFVSPFLKMARDAFTLNWVTHLRYTVAHLSDSISKAVGVKFFKEQEPFFIGVVKQMFRAAEKDEIKKHYFTDICLSLRKAGVMKDLETGEELEPTDELLAAQGFFFYVAGVEPTASALFGALTELGKHPEIQAKLQKEVDETVEKHGKVTYEIISEMKYLDQVLNETLRIQTPVGFINRICTRDSVLPIGNIEVSKGTKLYIPIFDLHFDPKYFPEPEKFDPERFSPENKGSSDMAYMPFGKGGRVCIGMRYARLQVLAGLLHLLRHFDVLTHRVPGSRKYAKGQFQMRRVDNDIELIPRQM